MGEKYLPYLSKGCLRLVKGYFEAWWKDTSLTGDEFELGIIGKVESPLGGEGKDYIVFWYDGHVSNVSAEHFLRFSEGTEDDLPVFDPYLIYCQQEEFTH